jgi:hypothetical protein
MFETFVKYILQQLDVIRNAPIPFATSVFVAAILIWLAMSWGYGRIIENKESHISILTAENERYRVALSLAAATPSALLKLTDKELQAKSLNVVTRLRGLISINDTQTRAIQNLPDKGDEAKKSLIESLQRDLDQQFLDGLKSDAFNVDFELRRRLGPRAVAGVVGIAPSIVARDGTRINLLTLALGGSEVPVFDLGFMPTLATGIEQMAKLLPTDG